MPVILTPALTAAGLSATTASIVATGGTLLIGIGVLLITSLLKSKQPKPSDGQVIIKESTSPRFRSYGRVKVAGVLMYANASYTIPGGYYSRVFAMGSGEIDEVEEHWIDDNQITLDPDTSQVTAPAQYLEDHAPRVGVEFSLGPDTGREYTELTAIHPEWTDVHLGKGIPSAWVALSSPKEKHFPAVFPKAGDTLYRQVQRGAKIRLIDEDLAFTEPAWSDNAAAVIMDYLTHPDGLRLPDSWITNAAQMWRDAIAICDEDMPTSDGEDTEARYRIWNSYYFDERPADVLGRFLQACDGFIYPTPDRGIGIKVGKWETPTVTIDDDAIIAFTDFGHGRDILTTANTIKARITNPDTDYQEYDVTPVADDDDVAARGEISSDIELFPVPSIGQATRLMDIALIRAAPNWAGKITCNLRALPAWGERFVRVKISELGVDEDFEILSERLIISEGNIVSGLELDISSDPYSDPSLIAACAVGGMEWRNSAPVSLNLGMHSPDKLDKNGNYYANEIYGGTYNNAHVYDADGIEIASLSYDDLWNSIYAFAGIVHAPVTPSGDRYGYYGLYPIYNGEYILAYIVRKNSIYFTAWWALLDPADLSTLGAYFYYFTVAPPAFGAGGHAYGALTKDQPILWEGNVFIGLSSTAIIALPSINEFLSGAAAWGWTPKVIKCAMLFPFGGETSIDTGFGRYLYGYIGNAGRSTDFGFILPDSAGGTNLYIYFNRSYMDGVAATSICPPEIKTVIQPANPYGCMVKIPLGNRSFADIAGAGQIIPGNWMFWGEPSGAYQIDNDSWIDSEDATAIPFLDEYSYISDDSAGGGDAYSMKTGVIDRGAGKFWVIFYMVGKDDAFNRNYPADPVYTYPIYERVRVFEYMQSTETAREIARVTCTLHNADEVPPDPSTAAVEAVNDSHQSFSVEDTGDVATIFIHSFLYKKPFLTLSVP